MPVLPFELKWLNLVDMIDYQMETFSALLAFCAGNSSVTGEFPSQRPVTRSFDVFFDLLLKKRHFWVNNREAGDLRRCHTHYDVTVMIAGCLSHICRYCDL